MEDIDGSSTGHPQAENNPGYRGHQRPKIRFQSDGSSKLQRAREMLRELRIDAEALLANAERRLARLS